MSCPDGLLTNQDLADAKTNTDVIKQVVTESSDYTSSKARVLLWADH